MHERYGPIVRINPAELHIADANFYDEVYAGGTKKRDKWPRFTRQFGIPESTFATVEHDLHRMRRSALNPFLSKGKVRELQPGIERVLGRLLGRFEEFQGNGEVMTVSLAFAALTNGMYIWWKIFCVDSLLSEVVE
jgi:cytochrome P450